MFGRQAHTRGSHTTRQHRMLNHNYDRYNIGIGLFQHFTVLFMQLVYKVLLMHSSSGI